MRIWNRQKYVAEGGRPDNEIWDREYKTKRRLYQIGSSSILVLVFQQLWYSEALQLKRQLN
jgi:hypothetical protein